MVCQKHAGLFNTLLDIARGSNYQAAPYARRGYAASTTSAREALQEQTWRIYNRSAQREYLPQPAYRFSGFGSFNPRAGNTWYSVITRQEATGERDGGLIQQNDREVGLSRLPPQQTTNGTFYEQRDQTTDGGLTPLLRELYESITQSPILVRYSPMTKSTHDGTNGMNRAPDTIDKTRQQLAAQVLEQLAEFRDERTPHVHTEEEQTMVMERV